MQVSSAKFGFGRCHIPLVRYRFEIEFVFPAIPISLLDKWGTQIQAHILTSMAQQEKIVPSVSDLESEKIHSSLLALRERFFERFQSGCLAIGLAFVLHGYPRRVRLSYDECVMSKVKVAIHIEVRYHLVHCVRLRRLCHFPKDDVFDKEVVSLFLLPEWGRTLDR